MNKEFLREEAQRFVESEKYKNQFGPIKPVIGIEDQLASFAAHLLTTNLLGTVQDPEVINVSDRVFKSKQIYEIDITEEIATKFNLTFTIQKIFLYKDSI